MVPGSIFLSCHVFIIVTELQGKIHFSDSKYLNKEHMTVEVSMRRNDLLKHIIKRLLFTAQL